MPTYSVSISKGLKEPCSPYRQAYFFGAELNSVNADGWNCQPQPVGKTDTYDLSALTLNHEVLVALISIRNPVPGPYHIEFTWTRDRDSKILFRWSFNVTNIPGFDEYGYAYLGYTLNELSENGRYYVEIDVSGPVAKHYTQVFNVSGVREPEPAPVPVGSNFVDSIFSTVWDIGSWFHQAHYTASGWVWPFSLISTPLYWLYQLSFNLLTPIAHFGDWVSAVSTKVSSVLTSVDIIGLLRTWLTYAENAWQWVSNAWTNVTDIMTTWWSSTSQIVKAWIAETLNTALTQIASLHTTLMQFKAGWDDFRTATLPRLADWSGVDSLISSWFKASAPLWEGWQQWRGQVAEFFGNPFEWLWSRFTDWFLGPEEKA